MKNQVVAITELRACIAMTVLVLLLPCPAQADSPSAPVADAGPSRYADRNPIRLDGTGSFDPDGEPITEYHWIQVSGPDVVITDADTATPLIDGLFQNVMIQTVEIELVVSDGLLESPPDTVEITIVPRMTHKTMSVVNAPFRPELPTLITFGGGNCVDGGMMLLDAIWQDRFNLITGHYFYPYADHAYQIMVMLSALAPDYQQPIQTVGFSTGGNPASVVANVINRFFPDPRYAVNRMTLLDSYCDDDLDQKVADFTNNPVAGEPAWVDVYRSLPEPIPGALNVSFFPGGTHNTPFRWFLESVVADNWPDGDMYNHGLTGGYFLSVGGPARNLRIATDDLYYYFECPEVQVGCLQQTDGALYPGLVLEPVALIGPMDGAVADPYGDVLSCGESQHATSYELLFGPDPRNLTISVSETPYPPEAVVDDFPFEPTYWTIRVRDTFGSTISAPPRAIHRYDPTPPRRGLGRVSPGH